MLYGFCGAGPEADEHVEHADLHHGDGDCGRQRRPPAPLATDLHPGGTSSSSSPCQAHFLYPGRSSCMLFDMLIFNSRAGICLKVILLQMQLEGVLRMSPGTQVERAVRDGYDVRGLMYWTLVDNFEV